MDTNTLIIIGYLIAAFGLSKSLRHITVNKVAESTELFEKIGNFFKDYLLDKLNFPARHQIIKPGALKNTFDGIFDGITNAFFVVSENLQCHATRFAARIEEDEALRSWKIAGYIFQLLFLIAFAYADAIQLVNTLAVFYPQDEVPAFLQNLTISLLASSVGIFIGSGFIMADFFEFTHFGSWSKATGGFRKTIIGLLIGTIVATLLFDGLAILARISTDVVIVDLLSENFRNSLTVAGTFGINLVVLPMLTLTLLFFQGFVGLTVLYIVVIWLFSFLLRFINLAFVGGIWFLTQGIYYLLEVIIKIIAWALIVIFFILGWLLVASGVTLETILNFLKAVLDVIYFPMDLLVFLLKKYILKMDVDVQ